MLGAHIDPVSWDEALERIWQRASQRQSSYVGICNAHSVVTAAQDSAFAAALAGADMNTPRRRTRRLAALGARAAENGDKRESAPARTVGDGFAAA